MSDNTADLAGAVAALSSALESMELRQTHLATQVSTAKQRRRERLDQRVTTLLPDISGATMLRLKQEAPAFAAEHKVIAAFERNRKILWLFKPTGYAEALALLQAQLKLNLERQGLVSDDDQAIQRMESEKATLATQQSEALEMLRMMEKAHRTDAPLPAAAVSCINNLAQRGRNLGNARRPSASISGSRFAGTQSGAANVSSESNMDLWLWMMTDIPTSFRTLLLNSFSHHHDSTRSHLSAAPSLPANNDPISTLPNNPVSGDTLSALLPDPEPIATDDRLGAFS